MILPLLLTVSAIAVPLARAAPRWDAALAWVVGAALAACAGLFTQGFDHDEYVAIIETTRQLADQDLAIRLISAKDPVFLFLIDSTGALTENVQLVFLVVAVLAVSAKVLATAVMPRRRTQFMAMYALFVAPGLEFAAIRAGLAVGLVMVAYLAVSRVRWRVLWVSLGLASHFSVLLVVAGRVWPRWWRAMLIGLVVLVPVAVPAIVAFAGEDVRYLQYLDNRGTPAAFLMPGLTAIAMLLLIRSMRGRTPAEHPLLSKDALVATSFVVVMALLLTLPVVTAATRVMELAWVFMLMQMIARDRLIHRHVLAYQAGSWCAMIVLLSLANVLRGTWTILL